MKLATTISKLNRRGISAVISNLILMGAVIAVGFAVLAWSQYQSSSYNSLYGNAIKADMDQLRERVSFEFIYYDATANALNVYLMNSGTIGEVIVASVYVGDSSYASPTLFPLNDTDTPISSLDIKQEGFFSIYPSPALELGKNQPIMIVTGRGSSFVATFAT